MIEDDEPVAKPDQAPADRAVAAKVDAARLAVALIGAALVGVGGWLHYPPIGFAAAGGMLFAVAIVGSLRAR